MQLFSMVLKVFKECFSIILCFSFLFWCCNVGVWAWELRERHREIEIESLCFVLPAAENLKSGFNPDIPKIRWYIRVSGPSLWKQKLALIIRHPSVAGFTPKFSKLQFIIGYPDVAGFAPSKMAPQTCYTEVTYYILQNARATLGHLILIIIIVRIIL